MKIRHSQGIIFSGIIWFAIGLMLLAKGLRLIVLGDNTELSLILLCLALLVGFAKGKWVLSRTVNRVVGRIVSQPNPFPIQHLYPRSYYFIILGMVLLGVSLRFFPLNPLLHGAIDIAIGSALIKGAISYFRAVVQVNTK